MAHPPLAARLTVGCVDLRAARVGDRVDPEHTVLDACRGTAGHPERRSFWEDKRDDYPHGPGARIVVRDEEWLVRRVDPASDGGHLLTCDGVSDLVRGQASLFLTALEGSIAVLDPAETQLVADTSPMFNAALLAIESQRRRLLPNDARIHLGHRAVINSNPTSSSRRCRRCASRAAVS